MTAPPIGPCQSAAQHATAPLRVRPARRQHLTIVLPTHNEAENLSPMVQELLALDLAGVETSILVVDGASTDGTDRIAYEIAREEGERFGVVHLPEKGGLGDAYRAGFARALDDGADLIVQMDCDFSHQPRYIPELLQALAGADMVLGSRFVRGGSVDESWPLSRRLLSRFANQVWVRLALHIPLRDATGGFRLWRRETLLGMDLVHRVRSSGYVFQVETAYLAHRMGYRLKEIPIHFPERKRGESKMDLRIQLEAALRVLQLRAQQSKKSLYRA